MTTTFLKDYKPCAFQILSTDLTFDIESLFDVVVTNRMHMRRRLSGPLILNGDGLKLKDIALNQQVLPSQAFDANEVRLEIFDVPDEFVLTITTQLNPEKNLELMGLYASRGMLCTQCEAEGFRRITYYFDRPDVMSCFTTKIIANLKQFPQLLSNGNLIETGTMDENRHYAIWHDPFLKPCYLFALVAGDFHLLSDEITTLSGKKVGLDIYVEHGDEPYGFFAMQAMKDAILWDERRFGREYDLDRYMIVAVKDFNMGAMENKGLNIFNVKYVLADENTATDEDILGIQSVIGHEYFHNWTGNRVTCRDWFQLSLKEGLTVYRDQEFSSDMNDRVTQRIADVSNLRRIQFPEDAGAMAHPVQPKSYQEISNFYTSTVYEKGAELVRMLETMLGTEGFRRGMDLYFIRHDGQAVRIEEFLQAMSDANDYDLTKFRQWYDQSGTPIVEISEDIQQSQLHIHMKQSCPFTADDSEKKPLMIPIRFAVYLKDGTSLTALPKILMLTQEEQTFVFEIPEPSVLVNYLQGFSAPVILKRELSSEKSIDLMKVEQDGFALWDLKQQLMVQCIQKAYLNKTVPTLSKQFVAVMQGWMQHSSLSYEFLAELFKLPSIQECFLGLNEVDPLALAQAHEHLQYTLAKALEPSFKAFFDAFEHQESPSIRALKNVCLQYLMVASPNEFAPRCWSYFENAKNMTNRIAAFHAMMQTQDETLKQKVSVEFEKDWLSNEWVMDKWFYFQATQKGSQVLEKVQKLTNHPLFHWTNPNKVRMLMGAFTQNINAFHDIDGKGYAFLKDCILQVDAINPQVASRLCTPLTRFKSYDLKRQKQMQTVLQSLKKQILSKDLDEIVSKSLQSDI